MSEKIANKEVVYGLIHPGICECKNPIVMFGNRFKGDYCMVCNRPFNTKHTNIKSVIRKDAR